MLQRFAERLREYTNDNLKLRVRQILAGKGLHKALLAQWLACLGCLVSYRPLADFLRAGALGTACLLTLRNRTLLAHTTTHF